MSARATSPAWLPLTRMAWREVLLYGGGSFALAIAAAAWLSPWAALPPALLGLFVLQFFRDPARRIPDGVGLIVSPADGVVTDVEELVASPSRDGPWVKIGIYLSVFDVHVNRAPEAARVVEVRHVAGRFHNSATPLAARVNEHCWTLLERIAEPRHRMAVKQIAGTFARRIVCAARPGEVLGRGERFGMIKFGSRTELYLTKAPGLRVAVRPGDRVRGGSTVVAEYGPLSEE